MTNSSTPPANASSTAFAGVDWGASEHAVCIIDEQGARIKLLVLAHDADGLADLVAALKKHSATQPIPVAIERRNGLLVDTLVAAGHPVVPIHPNAVKASRPRYQAAASAKSDKGDAYLLADLLRTDGHRFAPLKPHSDEMKALKKVVRRRDDFVAQRVHAGNQLRATLDEFFPGAIGLFHDLCGVTSLAFLEAYPTPSKAKHIGPKRMKAFLDKHRYSGRQSAGALVTTLRKAPRGLVGPVEEHALGEDVLVLVAQLRTLNGSIQRLERDIAKLVEAVPMGKPMRSFPLAGTVNAAQIISEIGDIDYFASADHLAAVAGVTPVTQASGKHRHVGFRFACNKRLRKAITAWAFNTTRQSAWAEHLYDQAITRGKGHAHAVRILARAWINVLYRCLRDGTDYDETKHRAAQRFHSEHEQAKQAQALTNA